MSNLNQSPSRYCHYYNYQGEVMIPITREKAVTLVSLMTDKSVMSYTMGREIQGKYFGEPCDVHIMPLNDY